MHKHFEELCALAVTGQISGDSMAVLDQHVKDCDECRAFLQDLVALKAHVAPVVAANHARTYEAPEGMRERFLQRAAAAGIALNPGPVLNQESEGHQPVDEVLAPAKVELWFAKWPRLSLRFAMPVAAAVLCGIFGYWVALQRFKLNSPVPAPIVVSSNSTDETVAAVDADRLSQLQREVTESRGRVDKMAAELAVVQKEKRDLVQKLVLVSQSAEKGAAFEQQLKSVTTQLQSAQDRITKLTADLTSESNRAATSDAVLAAQQRVSEEANLKVASLQAQIDRFQDLGMEKGNAGELIAARNLHIVDVYDTESGGDRRKAFGRVFYVEGKSLVFYAYDLPAKARDRKFEFKVWGEQAGVKSISVSLGSMQNDSSGQSRWLLTCNDRKVLAKINAVYITREPAERSSSQPQGQKMMYAFLGTANHP